MFDSNSGSADEFLAEIDHVARVTAPALMSPLTMGDVNDVAAMLLELRYVMRVELFGSFARGENVIGSDIDLIICVPDYIAARFFVTIEDVREIYSKARTRLVAAIEALFVDWLAMGPIYMRADQKLDVFLLPMDWRDRLNQLQKLGNHKDPDFMSNIARDARVIAEIPGISEP